MINLSSPMYFTTEDIIVKRNYESIMFGGWGGV